MIFEYLAPVRNILYCQPLNYIYCPHFHLWELDIWDQTHYEITGIFFFFFFGGGAWTLIRWELLCRLWTSRLLKSFIIMLWNHQSCQYSNHGRCYNMFEFWWYTRDFWGVLYTIWILFTRETFTGKINIWTCVYCKLSRCDASNLFYLMVLKGFWSIGDLILSQRTSKYSLFSKMILFRKMLRNLHVHVNVNSLFTTLWLVKFHTYL